MNRHRPRAVADRVSAPAPRRRRARIFSHRTPPRALAPALALARAPRASSSPARPPAGSERPRARGRAVGRTRARSIDRAIARPWSRRSSIAREPRVVDRANPPRSRSDRAIEKIFSVVADRRFFFFRAARISRISPRSTYCAFEKRHVRDRASRGRSIGARDRAIESLAARGCFGARSRARSRMGFHTSAHRACAPRRAARAFATRRVARCSRARPSRAARASR